MARRFVLLLAVISNVASLHADEPLRQVIDKEIQAVWKRDGVKPAARADDSAFLRRIHLDLVGTIPTFDEAKNFLTDADPRKREKVIDRLLDDPRFAANQANVWDQILFGRNPPGGDATRKRDDFKAWLTEQFAKNQPYDKLVRDLLLAEQPGSEMFYVQFRNTPEDATVATTRIFLGTQLQCARCHDHPYESWTQKDFYGMAGFFVRLVVVDGGTGTKKRYVIGEKSTGDVLFTGSVKEQKPGQKGVPVAPKFLGGMALDEPTLPKDFKEPDLKGNKTPPPPKFSRKEKLAEWLTSPTNPYFARAMANRIWSQYLGRGLVHPIDDLSEQNQPTHPEILKAITKHVVDAKFDLKGLIRELVNSETYQLASVGTSTEALPQMFERARVRPLSAEELQAAIRVATRYDGKGSEEGYFERYFGTPMDGQGNFQASLSEHLFLNNSGQIRTMIQARKGTLADSVVTSKAPWDEKVDQLFLSVLSRMPSDVERQKFVEFLSAGTVQTTPGLVEEALWVLLSCSEFRFNH